MQEVLTLYQNIPLHINPVAFAVGSFAVRWYGLMYLVGFLVAYGLLRLRIINGEFEGLISNSQFLISNKISNSKSQNVKKKKSEKEKNLLVISYQLSVVLDYLLMAFFTAIIGGRLGYVLFYNAPYYIANPMAIISPLDQGGNLVGIFGMSYHGALLGIILGSYIFLRKKRINFLAWADFVAPAAALGYFFGRVGNFLNGELYGRITNSPWGMYFGGDPGNLRHPSQLYEAFLEGIFLFVVLWKMRDRELPNGFLFGVYLFGYGLLRIFVEQFREPDAQLGLFLNYFTMGQLLSVVMIVCGGFLLFPKKRK